MHQNRVLGSSIVKIFPPLAEGCCVAPRPPEGSLPPKCFPGYGFEYESTQRQLDQHKGKENHHLV